MERLQTPPIRTALANEGGRNAATAQTAKEWYYFWRLNGDQTNANTQKLDLLITSGTHKERPDTNTMPVGALYTETDRGNAIYQNNGEAWELLYGVMEGTLTPDQRPTDLGADDSGFQFWAIDQTPVRKFIWSAGAWIDETPALYGTHASRISLTPAGIAAGVLFIETDRGRVIYQLQGGQWRYSAGIMPGTLSPDQRPADLGASDAGFMYLATDTSQFYRWSGSAWILQTPIPTPTNTAQYAQSNSSLTLTTSNQAVPGASLSLSKTGNYLITGTFYFNFARADAGALLIGNLNVGSSQVAWFGCDQNIANFYLSISQNWVYNVTAPPVTVNLMAYKTGGAGNSSVGAPHTVITATYIG